MRIHRRGVLAGGLALGMGGCATATSGGAAANVEPAPAGRPSIGLASFDLAALGYRTDEYFVSGTASSYERTNVNPYDVRVLQSAPYITRMVVVRPADASRFNGTVLVEWMNVSSGHDLPVAWIMAHRELMRSGYAYVGFSAQAAGITGNGSPIGTPLMRANPERYARLSHPGDAYSYDMFSQVGRIFQTADGRRLLGASPQRVIAAGESQSAAYLSTYVNCIDPVARAYDGFLVHSRSAGAASLSPGAGFGGGRQPAPFRTDLRVPTLAFECETDVVGYSAVRIPDYDKLRVWEVAGTAHGDTYMNQFGVLDSGALSVAELAQGYAPLRRLLGFDTTLPINSGIVHHYVMQAAIAQLDQWLRNGAPPPSSPLLQLGQDSTPEVDANGIARGGIRTPWVDVPTVRLAGVGNSGSPLAGAVGVGEPFEPSRLAQLYPGGRAEYLRRFQASLDASISGGFVLAADRDEILALAAAMYPVG